MNKTLLEKHMEKYGFVMSKKISSGGVFTSPTYDTRRVYSLDEMWRLNQEGFKTAEDLGLFIFNAIITQDE